MIASQGARRWVLISEVFLLVIGWTVLHWSPDAPLAANSFESPSPTEGLRLPLRSARVDTREILGKLPLSFEENEGQQEPSVRFSARGNGYRILLTNDGPSFVFNGENAGSKKSISIRFPTQTQPRVTGVEKLPGTTNYFIGRNRSGWKTRIAKYARVKYEQVFPGIDIAYYGRGHDLEYDLVAEPGADTSKLQFSVSGTGHPEDVRINESGDLILRANDAELTLHRPIAYQQMPKGKRRQIEARYALPEAAGSATKNGQFPVSIQVENYDRTQQLVVDPVVSFSTFLGGTSLDYGTAIAVDSAGNSYVAGFTYSGDFPTVNPFQSSLQLAATNAFITKINAAGTAILYSTYLGGSASGGGNVTNGGSANGIAVDSSGNAYVVGDTDSSDFPVTPGAFNASCTTCPNMFITKLDSTGSQLVYSTYFGGIFSPGDFGDTAWAVAVDGSGSSYVAGRAGTESFPTTPGAFQTTGDGAFVSKLNPSGSGLSYSTLLVDAGIATGVKVDSAGNAYITGAGGRNGFPTTPGAFQTASSPGSNPIGFVTKFNNNGSALIYSTLLGGTNWDEGNGIDIDTAGNAYVVGQTFSTDFPLSNAYQSTLNGPANVFVSKLNSSGTGLIYSTYLGGSRDDWAAGVAVDSTGNAYITGYASSTDFPVVGPLQSIFGGGSSDAFLTVMSPNGSPTFSTFLGGDSSDQGYAVAVDSSSNAYVAGTTASINFPAINAVQPALAIGTSCTVGCVGDAFVTKFAVSQPTPAPDFALASSAASQTINSGQVATFQVTVAPIGGFTQPVKFNCSGQAASSTCTLPASWSSNGLSTLNATVTVVTTPQGAMTSNPSSLSNWHVLIESLSFAVLAMCAWLVKKRGRRPAWIIASIPLLCVIILSGCGSGSGGGGSSSGTQPGTYTIKITGTSGNITHALNLTLVVN